VTLGLAVVFPAVLALIVVIVQAALVWHARNLAQAAAAEGLRVERAPSVSVDAGRQRAEAFLTETSRQLLGDVVITASRSAGTVTVTVTGTALGVLPGLHLPVKASATGPVEAFVPDTGGAP
jgi:hypothetical protein